METFKEIYMGLLKFIAYIAPLFIVGLIAYGFIGGRKAENIEKEIRNNPGYADAEIIDIIPDTPTRHGIVNITLNYKFTAENGVEFEKNDVLTAVKTMDLPKFQVGTNIEVIYSKKDPNKSMPAMKNALEEFTEKLMKKKKE